MQTRIQIGLIFRFYIATVVAFSLDLYAEQQPLKAEPALVFQLSDKPIQGALLRGNTNADSFKVLGLMVEADESGRFVFGIGRDAPEQLSLVFSMSGGSQMERVVDVVQREYETQAIDGVEQKYVSPPAEVLARIRDDSARVKAARTAFDAHRYDYLDSFIAPADGPITGVYGSQRIFNGVPKRPHFGLDIAGPTGTAVVAPVAGKVTFADNDLYYSGGTLIIDHGRGVSSTFIHLDKIHVREGDPITKGQHIADMGATGRVTGPHLDWRMNWFNVRLDPALLLKEEPKAKETP